MDPDYVEQRKKQIKDFFDNNELPGNPIKLSEAETIQDPQKFVEKTLYLVLNNTSVKFITPYARRLVKLIQILENEKNRNT